MKLKVYRDRRRMSQAAAEQAAEAIRGAIRASGQARIIAATGASQIDFLEHLTAAPDVAWPRVEMFHLDEYIGIPIDHPASFRRYLLDRLIDKTGITQYHLLNGGRVPRQVAKEVGRELAASPVDIAFVGIGENGHLAFNDPPADFDTQEPYIVVALDDTCRRQQVGEGWFGTIDDVPTHAISMSVQQILKSREIICVVPEARKANAVKACIEGSVSPLAPASILQKHSATTVFLDKESASLLTNADRSHS